MMQVRILVVGAAVGLALGLAAAGSASGDDASSDSSQVADPSEAKRDAGSSALPIFVPPRRGAPVTRVGGATRSITTLDLPAMEAIVPETLGYTLAAQPNLYWFLSNDTDFRVDLTLVKGDAADPELEVTLPGPFEAGIQRIALSDYEVELEPGVTYQWYVTLMPDPNQRWQGRIAGGVVVRTGASAELQAKLDAASAESRPYVLAEEGVWYEAMDDLSQRIDATPGSGSLHAQRNALLEQVGLGHVATSVGSVAAP